MFIGSCKASREDILNSINGISLVDAQKERMNITQSHIDYLNTTICNIVIWYTVINMVNIR